MTIMELSGLMVLLMATFTGLVLAALPGPGDPPGRGPGSASLAVAILGLFVSGVLFGISVGAAHSRRVERLGCVRKERVRGCTRPGTLARLPHWKSSDSTVLVQEQSVGVGLPGQGPGGRTGRGARSLTPP